MLLRTVSETAERLNVCESTVWNLIRDGRLASVRIGRCRRISEDAIAAFIDAHTHCSGAA